MDSDAGAGGVKQQFYYGLGGLVYSVKEAAYAAFVLIFYTQVLGLSGTTTGVVLFLALIWDAISDPLVGTWSDRFDSPWGRRHPFMVAGAIPLGMGFVGLFSPPMLVVENSLYLACWLLFWSLWIRTAVTLFALPHLALVAEMATDYDERSRMLGIRMGFVFVGSILLPALAIFFLFTEVDGIDGRFVESNYISYGWMSALVVWVAATLCIWGTRGAIDSIKVEASRRPSGAGLIGLIRDFLLTLKNRNLRNLLFYDLAASTSYGIAITLNVMTWTYYWELSTNELALMMGIPALTAVPLALFGMEFLGRRWSKDKILSWAIVLMLLNSFWTFGLRMMDWIPDNGHVLVLALLGVQSFLFIFLFVFRVVAAFSIIADATDEHEADHGTRQEAGFFSAFAFTTKLSAASGPLYGGIALDFIGLKAGAMPGELSQATLDGLVWAIVIAVLPTMLIAWYFTLKISMTREQLAEIQQRIVDRKEVE